MDTTGRYAYGIDIGTTSLCGVVLDLHSRETLLAITEPNLSARHTGHDWEFVQDPHMIFSNVRQILQRLGESGYSPSAIGLTGQMHGILYLNSDGEPVSPLFTWQDGRGSLPCGRGVGGTYAEALSNATGYAVSTGYGLTTHYWHLWNGRVPRDTACICTIADYVAMKLAGRDRPVLDPTNAASLGLFDVKTSRFDPDALAKAGVEAAILPELVPSGTILGRTPEGVPIAAALGDNQANYLGTVEDRETSVLVNMGTGSQVSLYTDHFIELEGINTRPCPGGGFLLVGAALSGGKSYALLESFFREVIREMSGRDPGPLYGRMNNLALAAVPSLADTTLRVDPRFFGTRSDPHIKGGITGLDAACFRPAELTAGFLRGMAEELAEMYETLPASIRARVRTAVGSGNGIRRNELLQRFTQERFGLPLRIVPGEEEAACGAALLAGSAVASGSEPEDGALQRRRTEQEDGRT